MHLHPSFLKCFSKLTKSLSFFLQHTWISNGVENVFPLGIKQVWTKVRAAWPEWERAALGFAVLGYIFLSIRACTARGTGHQHAAAEPV